MICKKCGHKNDDNVIFCSKCGEKLEPKVETEEKTTNKIDIKEMLSKKPDLDKNKIILVGIVLVLVLGFFMFMPFNKEDTNKTLSINISDYIEMNYEGYDTIGRASATLNVEKLKEEYGDKVQFKNADAIEKDWILAKINPFEMLESSINLQIDKSSELTNGDKINVYINLDQNLMNYLNCRIIRSEFKTTVSDLTNVELVNPFEDITYTLNNVGEWVMINQLNGTYASEITFPAEEQFYLNDTVTLTLIRDNDYWYKTYGKIPTVRSYDLVLKPETPKAETPIGTIYSKVDDLNIRWWYGLDADKSGDKIMTGETRNVYEIRYKDDYTWYRISESQWVADRNGDWLTYREN